MKELFQYFSLLTSVSVILASAFNYEFDTPFGPQQSAEACMYDRNVYIVFKTNVLLARSIQRIFMIIFSIDRFSCLHLPSSIVKPLTQTPLKLHSNVHIFGTFRCTKSFISLHLMHLRYWSIAENTHNRGESKKSSPGPLPQFSIEKSTYMAQKIVLLHPFSFSLLECCHFSSKKSSL